MIVSSFYNKEEKVLILALGKEVQNKVFKQNKVDGVDEISIYSEEGELIGVNLIGYENDKLNSGIVNNNLVLDIISKYFGSEIESPYIVGYVSKKVPHPKSEKLNICQVDLGTKKVQIVCGAKNVEQDMKVIVSQVGAVMPNGLIIKPSKLIDEESSGMITSLFELGLSEDRTQGIAILDDGLTIGEPYYG